MSFYKTSSSKGKQILKTFLNITKTAWYFFMKNVVICVWFIGKLIASCYNAKGLLKVFEKSIFVKS
jgi:hypothetical protein